MSLYGMMRTGVSGMNAQANRLSTVADNIANAGTTGYKRSSTEFSSLIIPNVTGNYTSGGVTTSVRYATSQQGDLKYTSSTTDLAINGDGFFVVQDPSGNPFLTRAGSFVPDGDGRLVNAAGFYLMGYSSANGTPSAVTNGFGGLEPVLISQTELTAVPSKNGLFTANLPAGATVVAPANLPSANAATATASAKSSLVVYDNLGNEVLLDVYFTKTGTNTWEVAVYNQANAAPRDLVPLHRRSACPAADADLRRHHRQAHRPRARTTSIIPVPGGAPLHARPCRHQPAGDRLHGARLQGRRQRAKRHRQDRDRAKTAPSTRNTRTARSRRSTAFRSPRCRAPTSSTSSPATSIRKAAIPATSASALPMRAAWAAWSPGRSKIPTSTSPKN